MIDEKKRNFTLLMERIFLWLIWGGFLLAPLSFVWVEAIIFHAPTTETAPGPEQMWLLYVVGAVFGVCSIGLFHAGRAVALRKMIKRRSWMGMAIAYPIVKVVTWMACEGVVYFCLVLCILSRGFWPGLLMAAVPWLLMAMDPPLFRAFRRVEG